MLRCLLYFGHEQVAIFLNGGFQKEIKFGFCINFKLFTGAKSRRAHIIFFCVFDKFLHAIISVIPEVTIILIQCTC